MRWSNTLIPTLKKSPADAEITSHKLMIRAGLIRKLASGTYTYLPLGFRSLNKVINIIRDEMDGAGATEVLMPVLQPVDLWKESGRLDGFGDLMCRFKDRQGRINILGPTHEEIITHHVRENVNSYKQIPLTLYQIQTKFRDEIRPRFGVLRSREFIMKDAYSFDRDNESLNKSFDKMHKAYCQIMERCGLPYKILMADSGLMGGSDSFEFTVPTDNGEDTMVLCSNCNYAANLETASCFLEEVVSTEELKQITEVETPQMKTIEQVSKFLDISSKLLVKTLLYIVDEKPIALLIRGDLEVNDIKLRNSLKTTEIRMATDEEIMKYTSGPVGFTGPVGLKDVKILADLSIKGLTNFVAGGNKKDCHLTNVNIDRDFSSDGFIDIRVVKEGDPCPVCKTPLTVSRGIEIGHVFKLGTKYSEKLKAKFLDDDGKLKPFIMGCYGIGVNRIIAAAIETSFDEKGIIWPRAIAPYEVIIVSVNPEDDEIYKESLSLYNQLKENNIDVLWDDRNISAGIKFKDADLLGIPLRITLGKKLKADKIIDLKQRNKKASVEVSVNDALKNCISFLNSYNHFENDESD